MSKIVLLYSLIFFSGTNGYNYVVVHDESQMLKGSRFIWYYWTQFCCDKFIERG